MNSDERWQDPEWILTKKEEAKRKSEQLRTKAIKRFDALSPEEKRRRIRMRLYAQKEKEIRGRIPHSGFNETAPEWFVTIPLPPSINTALGFDFEGLKKRIERIRGQFAAILQSPSGSGVRRLKEEIADLDETLTDLDKEFEENIRCGEGFVDQFYPDVSSHALHENEGDREVLERKLHERRFMLSWLRAGGSGVQVPTAGAFPGEICLYELIHRQQQINDQRATVAFGRSIAINLLERYRHNLPLDFTDFYALFEIPEEDINKTYARLGLTDADHFMKATIDNLKWTCEVLDAMERQESNTFSSHADMRKYFALYPEIIEPESIEKHVVRTLQKAGLPCSSSEAYAVLSANENAIREAYTSKRNS